MRGIAVLIERLFSMRLRWPNFDAKHSSYPPGAATEASLDYVRRFRSSVGPAGR